MKKLLYSTLTFSALALLVTGCSSTKKEIKPKEYTSVPLYMAGQEIPDGLSLCDCFDHVVSSLISSFTARARYRA
mgnify:CR=1 FL=1